MENQHRDFDPKSTSLARLKTRRDELRERGIGIASLNRLINKMERPAVKPVAGWKIPQNWLCAQKDLQGGGTKAAKKTPENSGKPKASHRAQQRN